MDISRRDFIYLASALGLGLGVPDLNAAQIENISFNDLMYKDFEPTGNVTLMHICDLHAHLKPLYWR